MKETMNTIQTATQTTKPNKQITAQILEHFSEIDRNGANISELIDVLDLTVHNADSDFGTVLRAVDSVAFLLRHYVEQLNDHTDACYLAVRKGWGYDS